MANLVLRQSKNITGASLLSKPVAQRSYLYTNYVFVVVDYGGIFDLKAYKRVNSALDLLFTESFGGESINGIDFSDPYLMLSTSLGLKIYSFDESGITLIDSDDTEIYYDIVKGSDDIWHVRCDGKACAYELVGSTLTKVAFIEVFIPTCIGYNNGLVFLGLDGEGTGLLKIFLYTDSSYTFIAQGIVGVDPLFSKITTVAVSMPEICVKLENSFEGYTDIVRANIVNDVIEVGVNDTIDFSETVGVELNAIIPPGSYNKFELAEQAQIAFNEAGSSNYTVQYENSKFAITSDGSGGTGIFRLLNSSGSHAPMASLDLMGFIFGIDYSDSLSYTSDQDRYNEIQEIETIPSVGSGTLDTDGTYFYESRLTYNVDGGLYIWKLDPGLTLEYSSISGSPGCSGVFGNSAGIFATFLESIENQPQLRLYEIITGYGVSYNGNGNTSGTEPTDSNSYDEGDTVTVLGKGDLVKTGSNFLNWNTQADGEGVSYDPSDTFLMGTENVTLYAIWQVQVSYTVTYDGNGSTGGTIPVDPSSYSEGDTVTVLDDGDLVRTGYSFSSWNTESDGSGTTYIPGETFFMGSENITLYAVWQVLTYYVTYSGNGSTGGTAPVDSNSYEDGQEVVVLDSSDLVRTGYAFLYWNTESDGSGVTYEPGDTFYIGSSDILLYAIWEERYTVTYSGNGNTGGYAPVDPTIYEPGQEATILDLGSLVKTNHLFLSWNTMANGLGTKYVSGDVLTINSNVVLYAIWQYRQNLGDVFNFLYKRDSRSFQDSFYKDSPRVDSKGRISLFERVFTRFWS